MMKANRKRYLIIGGVIAAVLILLLMVVNATSNGTLEIKTPSTQNNTEVEVTITLDNNSTQTYKIAPSTTRTISLKTGTHRVNSAIGDVKAVDIVKITASQNTRLELKFGSQLTAQKVGTDAEYCPYLVESTLYSYNCRGDGFVYRHPGADARKIPIMDATFFGALTTYSTGFLGYVVTDPNSLSRAGLQLQFIDMKTQTAQKLTLPAGIPTDNMTDNIGIATSTDPAKMMFALIVRDQSKIYLFKNTADQNPVAITLPDKKKFVGEHNATSFSFDGDTFVAYLGHIVDGEEEDGQEDFDSTVPNDGSTANKADGHVYEYDLSGKLTRTVNVPDDFWADTLTRLNANYFAASNVRGTDIYFLRDGRLEKIYSLGDGISTLVAKGNLYMVVDNGIFAFTPQQNGLFGLANIFNNKDMRVSAIYDSPGPLLFTAFDSDSQNTPLNIYNLSK